MLIESFYEICFSFCYKGMKNGKEGEVKKGWEGEERDGTASFPKSREREKVLRKVKCRGLRLRCKLYSVF